MANGYVPVLITCEATSEDQMCDLTLKLIIPSPEICSDVLKEEENLYSLNTVSTRRNNTIVISEFSITPKSKRLHGTIAICGVNKNYRDLCIPEHYFEPGYVLIFSRYFINSPSVCPNRSVSVAVYFPIIIYTILSVLVIILTAIAFILGFCLMRLRKTSVPKEQGLLITLDQVSETAGEKTKQQEVEETLISVDPVPNSSASKRQEEINSKLPDNISSRNS